MFVQLRSTIIKPDYGKKENRYISLLDILFDDS